jgi:peptidoglycan/LPS O-acetylase OafA/YrhL
VLYAALLPNLMHSLYRVGGILSATWSIGVEEQFYLVWAPAVKRLRGRLPLVCGAALAASLALFCLNHGRLDGGGWGGKFLDLLRFHFMAAGGLTAWALHRHRDALLRLPVFTSRVAQIALCALLADLYLTSFLPWNWLSCELAQLVLYSWLIVEVGANPRRLLAVGNRACDRLGEISYGIYMLHLPAFYVISALFLYTSWWRGGSLTLYLAVYYALAFTLTWLLAWTSHRFYERPFLRWKERRFTVVPTAPGPPDADPGAGGEWPGGAAAAAP